MSTKNIEHIFCPKCGCMSLENDWNDELEWVANDEVAATERYVCTNCQHGFTVSTSYTLCGFNFLDDDDDGIDYEIIEEE